MIEMKDVHYSYSKKDYALKGVSFTIPDGKWISILGHNGSGKSTVAKLLVGLLEANKGTITIDGLEMKEENLNDILKKIGIVFQNPDNQFVGITVKHDIAFGLENQQIERSRMLELINEYASKVGLDGYLDREPHTLSGGEKQRCAIAGILALNLKYIIFDEATSMLDPKGVNEVTNLICDLKNNSDKTIITITHDLELAKHSDEIIVLDSGKVAAVGKPEEIFKLEEVLNNTNLEVPFELDLYNKALHDEKLVKNEKLMEALCQLSL